MRLTAQLAYSQVKANRSRTLWTLLGILLSAALITAVCSFVASGNALFKDLLGERYLDYAGALSTLLMIPAGLLSAIIVFMAVIVISNAFRVSASERTQQFGILKSVGATERQIMHTVMYESILLSAVGIPLGLIMGLIFAFAGVQVANHLLGELNSLVHLMMNELILVIDFVVAWQALLAAALISFLSVLISAWLPARKAARIAAIDSVRGAGVVKIEAKQIRTSPLLEKLFGFEGTLAAKNIKRNKRNFRASVVSLTIGIILFINLSAISQQASYIEDQIYPDVDATVLVEYTSLLNDEINEATGKEESRIVAPITSETADRIGERLRKFEDTRIFGVGSDMKTYTAVVPSELLSPQMKEAMKTLYPEEPPLYSFSVDMITLDPENYARLCEKADVPQGSTILLNHYSYNDNGTLAVIAPFLYKEGAIQVTQVDDTIHEIPIQGVLTHGDIPLEILGPNVGTVRLLVPQGVMRGYSWFADPDDIDGFMTYAKEIMAEMFPHDPESTYIELGYNTRVYKIKDYMKVMNIFIVLATVFVYSFVALLTLIGLTNVISTISANVHMRSREFAVLQSVGMSHSGLNRMLNLESILCSAKALLIGLPLALVLTYLMNRSIRSVFPVPYQLPWLAVLCCIAAVFLITWVTIRYSAFRLHDRNIIETIRSENGR